MGIDQFPYTLVALVAATSLSGMKTSLVLFLLFGASSVKLLTPWSGRKRFRSVPLRLR
jgi:hypothetical protein